MRLSRRSYPPENSRRSPRPTRTTTHATLSSLLPLHGVRPSAISGGTSWRPRPRTNSRQSVHSSGIAASNATDTHAARAPVMTNIPAFVADPDGADHCHPMVSWDHIAMPAARKAATEKPSVASPRRTCCFGCRASPARPANASRARTPLRSTSAVRLRDRGRSEMSSSRSWVNSSPYRARHSRG